MSGSTLHLFAPTGGFVNCVITRCITGADINELHHDGTIADFGFNDFPTMREYEGSEGIIVDSSEDGEYLLQHCRLVAVDNDFSPWDVKIPPWPDEIVAACGRMCKLSDGLQRIEELGRLLPDDFRDTTTAQVLDAVITKRIVVEIETLRQQIELFRQGREEPTAYGHIAVDDDGNEEPGVIYG